MKLTLEPTAKIELIEGAPCRLWQGTVRRWIEQGWLRARRRGTHRVADQWWIHRRDVRAFIADHVAVVDIRKCDKVWLVELLTGRNALRAEAA